MVNFYKATKIVVGRQNPVLFLLKKMNINGARFRAIDKFSINPL